MIRFNNDYNHGAHPAVLEALTKTNDESYGGYGLDIWCERAAEEIKKCAESPDAAVHFLIGGTQTNYTVIAAALRPYQGVISADTGHIHVHETGAVENTGHKIIALPSEEGKITARQIEEQVELYQSSGIKEHITQPKMVYLSFPTEYGTIYSKKEFGGDQRCLQKIGLLAFHRRRPDGIRSRLRESGYDIGRYRPLCGRFFLRRNKVRHSVRRGRRHYRSGSQCGLSKLYQTERRNAGEGLASGSSVLHDVSGRAVF